MKLAEQSVLFGDNLYGQTTEAFQKTQGGLQHSALAAASRVHEKGAASRRRIRLAGQVGGGGGSRGEVGEGRQRGKVGYQQAFCF